MTFAVLLGARRSFDGIPRGAHGPEVDARRRPDERRDRPLDHDRWAAHRDRRDDGVPHRGPVRARNGDRPLRLVRRPAGAARVAPRARARPPRSGSGTDAEAMTSRAWLALGTVYIVWGSTYLGIALAGESIPPIFAASVRFLLTGALMAGVRRRTQGSVPFRVGRSELGSRRARRRPPARRQRPPLRRRAPGADRARVPADRVRALCWIVLHAHRHGRQAEQDRARRGRDGLRRDRGPRATGGRRELRRDPARARLGDDLGDRLLPLVEAAAPRRRVRRDGLRDARGRSRAAAARPRLPGQRVARPVDVVDTVRRRARLPRPHRLARRLHRLRLAPRQPPDQHCRDVRLREPGGRDRAGRDLPERGRDVADPRGRGGRARVGRARAQERGGTGGGAVCRMKLFPLARGFTLSREADLVRPDGRPPQRLSGRVPHRRHDGCGRHDGGGLADALDAVRRVGLGILDQDRFDRRHVERRRQEVVREARVHDPAVAGPGSPP